MIKGFIGTYGSGKSLWLTRHAQWYFKRDLPVISNMPIWGYNSKGEKVMAKFIYNDDIYKFLTDQLFQDKLTLLIVDEASAVFDSYNFKKLPPEVFEMLKQSRKIKLDIYYTSQRHQDIMTRVRDNSTILYLCKPILPYFKWSTIYSAIGVEPHYFSDKAKSTEMKQYILNRRFTHFYSMRKYFKFFMTEFIITTKSTFKKFEYHLGDPTKITPDDIINSSAVYKELRAPI